MTSSIEKKVFSTIDRYDLIQPKDKVLVAFSGGKDSTVILHILNKKYLVSALLVDLKIGEYSRLNVKNAVEFCKKNDIKLHIIDLRDEFGFSLCYIKDMLKFKGKKLNSCTVCGILRRYILNKAARELGYTKIVTGHNLDDEAQSILMNYLRNNLEMAARLGPSPGILRDKKFVPRIKPLYFCAEKEIVDYSKKKGFNVLYGRCPCVSDSYRNQVRNQLNLIEKENPSVKHNIVNSFQKILPKLKRMSLAASSKDCSEDSSRSDVIRYCDLCGEPNSGSVCRACQIIDMLR